MPVSLLPHWLVTVPLMGYIAITTVYPSRSLSIQNIFVIAGHILSIALGALAHGVTESFDTYLYLNLASCCCAMVSLYDLHLARDETEKLQVQLRRQSSNVDQLQLSLVFAKRRENLTAVIAYMFPLFPAVFYARCAGLIDDDVASVGLNVLSVATKVVFSMMCFDANRQVSNEGALSIEASARAKLSRRTLLRYLAHELRGPLNAIMMSIDAITEAEGESESHYGGNCEPMTGTERRTVSGVLSPSQREALDQIRAASVVMEETLSSAGALQVLEEGTASLQRAPFTLLCVLDGVSLILRREMACAGGSFRYQVDEESFSTGGHVGTAAHCDVGFQRGAGGDGEGERGGEGGGGGEGEGEGGGGGGGTEGHPRRPVPFYMGDVKKIIFVLTNLFRSCTNAGNICNMLLDVSADGAVEDCPDCKNMSVAFKLYIAGANSGGRFSKLVSESSEYSTAEVNEKAQTPDPFDPYQVLRTHSMPVSSLVLATCKELVHLMGGSIAHTPRPDNTVLIVIVLPLQQFTAASEQQEKILLKSCNDNFDKLSITGSDACSSDATLNTATAGSDSFWPPIVQKLPAPLVAVATAAAAVVITTVAAVLTIVPLPIPFLSTIPIPTPSSNKVSGTGTAAAVSNPPLTPSTRTTAATIAPTTLSSSEAGCASTSAATGIVSTAAALKPIVPAPETSIGLQNIRVLLVDGTVY
jgi:signal transduction histidine kinase